MTIVKISKEEIINQIKSLESDKIVVNVALGTILIDDLIVDNYDTTMTMTPSEMYKIGEFDNGIKVYNNPNVRFNDICVFDENMNILLDYRGKIDIMELI